MKTKINISLLLLLVILTCNYQLTGQTPCPGVPMVTYEGHVYNTVMIGQQCWFKENLDVGTFLNSYIGQSDNGITEKYCFEDDPSNCAIYGALYQWNEMMQYIEEPGAQGICPAGWHIPTNEQWTILADFLGGENIAGGALKETGTVHWNPPNTGATNSSGFTALGPGYLYGGFYHFKDSENFWTSTQSSSYYAWYRNLSFGNVLLFKGTEYPKSCGFSVRCMRDTVLDAGFGVNKTSICNDSSVIFTDASTGLPNSWIWSFPGGTPSSYSGQSPPPIRYSSIGSYNVSLTVSNGITSDTEAKPEYIEVKNIVADFTGTPTTVIASNTVIFTNNSACDPTSWNWFFPGGSPSSYNGQNPPAIVYSTPGTYDVTLRVSNQSFTDTRIRTGYITVNPSPFNMTNGSITTCSGSFYDSGGASGNYQDNEHLTETFYPSTPGSMIRFTFLSFSTEGGFDQLRIYNGTSTSAPLIGAYDGTSGPETVTASNASGALTFFFTSDGSINYSGWEATINCQSPPDAGFEANNNKICTDSTVIFTNKSTGSPSSWMWGFPGGTPSSFNGQNPPPVSYSSAGSYDVSLSVSNGIHTDTETRIGFITVKNVIADFTGVPTTVIPGDSVIFTDNSNCIPLLWNWTFPGGTPSSYDGQNPPPIIYITPGIYDVTLTTTNGSGSDTKTRSGYISVVICPVCPSSSNNANYEWISKTEFNTIDNSSDGISGYEDFTSVSTTVKPLSTYTLSVSCGSTGTFPEHCRAFFDWNQNCDFSDEGETYDLGEVNGQGTLALSIPIPSDALNGKTRMRVSLKYGSVANPCEIFDYGQVEDYSINIQTPSIELTFNAVNNGAYVRLDSTKVMNRTNGNDTILHWPDTTLTLKVAPGDKLLAVGYSKFPVGIQELDESNDNFQVFQNYPNPVKDNTLVTMHVPGNGTLLLKVTDMLGREVVCSEWMVNKGHHTFRFNPGNGTLFSLTAYWNGTARSIKILNAGIQSGNKCSLEYLSSENREYYSKTISVRKGSGLESGIPDKPDTSEVYTFQFATKISCPGIPVVAYEGHVYNTIQIFSQCWLKENLNVGKMIPGTQNMSNDGIIEKYCYDDDSAKCAIYGGLYQWDEMMQYSNQEGVQGICPPGWHIPDDEEWKVLEGAVDSQYGIGDIVWDNLGHHGYDDGKNLKTSSGWDNDGNGTDLYRFSALPDGLRDTDGTFKYLGNVGAFWTSTKNDAYLSWYRGLFDNSSDIDRFLDNSKRGNGVRCLMD